MFSGKIPTLDNKNYFLTCAGKWCRKPDLPLEIKGARAVILCMEPSNGFEKRDGKLVPRRPRSCSNEETDGGDNACACYILNIAGQNGYKVITLIR